MPGPTVCSCSQFAVEHEEGLVLLVVDVYRAAVAAPVEVLEEGVRFVPVTGHQLTLQAAWAADNANPALPAFLQTAWQIARKT